MLSPNSTNEIIISYIKPIKYKIKYSNPDVNIDLLIKRINNFQEKMDIEKTKVVSLIQFDVIKSTILVDSINYHYENSQSILIACLSCITSILMNKLYTLEEKKNKFDIIIALMISELTIPRIMNNNE